MPDYTPGPWIVAPPNGSGEADSALQFNGRPYQEYTKITTVPTTIGYRKGVAHVYQGEGGVGSPRALAEQRANCILIAAAPDLLAALRILLDRCENLDQSATHDGLQNCTAIAAASAAIAKATGETSG